MLKLQILAHALIFCDGQKDFHLGFFWARLLAVGTAWVSNNVMDVDYPHCEVEDSRLEGREQVLFRRMDYAGGSLYDMERRLINEGARHCPNPCKCAKNKNF